MDLVVVRHAIAFDRDVSRWPDDRERPLTPDGEDKFRRAAAGLRRAVGAVEVMLSSPLVRAWQTAEILVDEAGWPEPIACEPLEPDRSAADVAEALDPYRTRGAVAVVGHEPLLGELIAFLVTGSDDGGTFPLKKGGSAFVEVDAAGGEDNSLRWLLTPKIERALGP